MENIILFILTTVFTILILICFFYKSIRKTNDTDEKFYYFVSFIVISAPLIVYSLDKYNIPTELGWCANINTQNWLDFIGNYFSAGIGIIISVFITIYQIKKNNEENSKRDKENLRVQNMPILKYFVDTKDKEKVKVEDLIITNIDDGHAYNLNISIKNIGLNNIKNIKVDLKSSLINNSTYRMLGDYSLEVLEKGEEITINKFIFLKGSEEPYDMDIIVYYEDVLSNWYKQILNVHYTATNISQGGYIGIARYEVNKEEIVKEEDIESKVL